MTAAEELAGHEAREKAPRGGSGFHRSGIGRRSPFAAREAAMKALERADIRLRLLDSDRRLEVELDQGERKLVGFTLEAPELDRLIALLAGARAHMADPVPPTLDPGSRIAGVASPAWRVAGPDGTGRQALALRHPGFGWIGFALSAQEARALAAALGPHGRPALSPPPEA